MLKLRLVLIVVLCIFSDHALNFNKFHANTSNGLRVME